MGMASFSLSALKALALVASANAQLPWFTRGNGEGLGFPGFSGPQGGFPGFGGSSSSSSSSSRSSSNSGTNDNDISNNAIGGPLGGGSVGNSILGSPGFRSIAIYVHGSVSAIIFVFILPIGSIFMRVIPGRFAWITHSIVQIIGFLGYIATASLGIYLAQNIRSPPNNKTLLQAEQTRAHQIIGIVTLIMLLVQPYLGSKHLKKFKELGRRTEWSYAHLGIGRSSITLGMINGALGLRLVHGTPNWVTVAYSIVAATMWLFWIAFAVWSEIKQSRAIKHMVPIEEPSYIDTPTCNGFNDNENEIQMRPMHPARQMKYSEASFISSYGRRASRRYH